MNESLLGMLWIIGLFALLYFLLIRPQQIRQKKHMEMVKNLRVNDNVITIGGMLGTVVKLKDNSVVLKVAENVKVEFLKTSIAQVRNNSEKA